MSVSPHSRESFQQAVQLHAERRFAEAAAILRSLARPVLTLNVAVLLGVCLLEDGQFAEAEHWLGLAAGHRPDDPDLQRLMGNLYGATDRVAEAETAYRRALQSRPDDPQLQVALAGLLLSVGRFAEAWPLMEARVALIPEAAAGKDTQSAEWKGEPLEGRSIIVRHEQGFGDQIQMSRFAPQLKSRGASKVALACRPALAPLLATLDGVDEVLPVAAGAAPANASYELWTRYFSLPLHLGVTLQNLPVAPYLSAPAERSPKMKLDSRVGLAWRAAATGPNGDNKSLPQAAAARLLGAGLASLHPEDTGASDFADTAGLIGDLELVVSVDTAVAHVAGALGKSCWTLLPRLHTDWRWMRGRADSPWYPTMRLFRQQRAKDWEAVVDEVLDQLRRLGLP